MSRLLLIMAAVAAYAVPNSAWAADQLRQPHGIVPVAFEYDSYYLQDAPATSPSDLQPTPATPRSVVTNGGGSSNGASSATTTATSTNASWGTAISCGGSSCGTCSTCTSCDSGCGRGARFRNLLPGENNCFGSLFACCNNGETRHLVEPCCDLWSVGGWLNAGVLTNAHGSPTNGPVPFISTNDLLMNQLWTYVERATDTGGCGWDLGVRFDYIFGADGPDTQAFGDGGWDFGWNGGGQNIPEQTYGSAIPQLYTEIAYNDLKVKLGRFYTIIGYEVVQAPDNFFYTHAYTMNYGEPFTHTGALGEYSYSEDTTLYGGYVSGWDSGWENLNDAHMYIGGMTLDWWEDASITYALTAGDFGAGQGDVYMHSVVFNYQITDAWSYVFQSDLGIQNNVTDTRDNHWYGINQYLFYEINCCWSMGFRFEWFRDEDGSRIAGDFPSRGHYYDVSFGFNYKPNANVIIRPEVRGDWFEASDEATARLPFDNNTEDKQLMAGIDFILLW